MKTNKILAVIFFIFFLAFFIQSNTLAQTFYVSYDAAPGGVGTLEDPYNIQDAINNAQPGYTFMCNFGDYFDFSEDPIDFNQSGSVDRPIIWKGTINEDNFWTVDADGTISTVFYGDNSISLNSPRITISGSYQEFRDIIFKQGQPGYLISITGNNVTFDHIATKYPSNTSSATRHLVDVYGKEFTLRNSHIRRSPKTAFWIRWDSAAPDEVLFEGNIWTEHSNHPAFQIMPNTDAVSPDPIAGVIIRNETFIDNNYETLFFLRHNNDAKIYNCESIRSGTWSFPRHPVSPYATTAGVLIAFNTIISNSTSFYPFNDQATQEVTFVNNIIYSEVSFSEDYLFKFNCLSGDPPILGHNFYYNTYYNEDYGSDFEYIALVQWDEDCSPYDMVYKAWGDATGQEDQSTTTVIPDFTDPSEDIYTLNTNITGIAISGISTDKNGYTRDANTPSRGCFEFQGGDEMMKTGLKLSKSNGHSVPEEYSLDQNYPNPFNPSTIISYRLPVSSYVTLKVIDVIGNEVATLIDEYRDAGSYEVEFNTSTINQHPSSGVYFYQLIAGDSESNSGQGFVETRKMLLLK